MKRKITSLLLALTMLASMGSIAYAAESGNGSKDITDPDLDGSASIEVVGNYEKSKEPDPVYSVNVSWQNMQFSCEVQGQKIWNPLTHTYSNQRKFVWENLYGSDDTTTKTQRLITVTNKSSEQVQVTATTKPESNAYGFKLSVYPQSPESVILESYADENDPVNSTQFDVDITPPGRPPEDMPANFQLGTVTITVNAVTP